MSPSRLIVALVLLASTLTLVACGASKEEFSNEYKKINQEILDTGRKTGEAIVKAPTQNNKQLEKTFNDLADEVDDERKKLDDLDAPSELKDKRSKLSDALETVAEDLRAIATAAGKNDPTAARAATVKLLKDSPPLRDARRALAKDTGAKIQ